MHTHTEYFLSLAAAYVRGKLQSSAVQGRYSTLFTSPLAELSEEELYNLLQLGLEQGLRIHRFKRTMDLPRVQRVLGMLKGIQPAQLLDIGSGRGAFLWPLLDAFPFLPVTCIDILDYRVADIQTVHEGGIAQVNALIQDVTQLPFPAGSFDVVTLLEVLEHIPDTRRVLAELCRVTRRHLIISVPSKQDDNPEHIHLFTQEQLNFLLQEQNVANVKYEYVPNHLLAIVKVAG